MVRMLGVRHLKESVRHFGTESSSSCSKDTGTTLECLPGGEGGQFLFLVSISYIYIYLFVLSCSWQCNIHGTIS